MVSRLNHFNSARHVCGNQGISAPIAPGLHTVPLQDRLGSGVTNYPLVVLRALSKEVSELLVRSTSCFSTAAARPSAISDLGLASTKSPQNRYWLALISHPKGRRSVNRTCCSWFKFIVSAIENTTPGSSTAPARKCNTRITVHFSICSKRVLYLARNTIARQWFSHVHDIFIFNARHHPLSLERTHPSRFVHAPFIVCKSFFFSIFSPDVTTLLIISYFFVQSWFPKWASLFCC